jgi:hypothetical protein
VGQPFLNVDRALDRVECAAKLHKQAIAGGTDDASLELEDLGFDDLDTQLG